MSSEAAATSEGRTTAAPTTTATTARGPGLCVLRMEGYNSQSSLDGVREQQASRGVDLVVLLLDVLGNLLQDLQARTGKRNVCS